MQQIIPRFRPGQIDEYICAIHKIRIGKPTIIRHGLPLGEHGS